ncbi:MAG: hypothetical protein DRQ13_02990, partial [Ignavibacteriae bacterium]
IRRWYNIEGYLPTSIYSNKNETSSEFTLLQNFPNPFNPNTTISFIIPQGVRQETQDVTLVVYDVLGNEIATLVNEEKLAGEYEVNFDATEFTSGVYFYRIEAKTLNGEGSEFKSNSYFVAVKKMMLLK